MQIFFKVGSDMIPRFLANSSIDHLHISVSILTLLVFSDFSWELLPFNADKRVNFLQSSMKITNIFPIFCIKFKCCNNLWIFYLIWNYPMIFYNVQISIKSINFMKIMMKIFVVSITLAWNGNHFILHKENNS